MVGSMAVEETLKYLLTNGNPLSLLGKKFIYKRYIELIYFSSIQIGIRCSTFEKLITSGKYSNVNIMNNMVTREDLEELRETMYAHLADQTSTIFKLRQDLDIQGQVTQMYREQAEGMKVRLHIMENATEAVVQGFDRSIDYYWKDVVAFGKMIKGMSKEIRRCKILTKKHEELNETLKEVRKCNKMMEQCKTALDSIIKIQQGMEEPRELAVHNVRKRTKDQDTSNRSKIPKAVKNEEEVIIID